MLLLSAVRICAVLKAMMDVEDRAHLLLQHNVERCAALPLTHDSHFCITLQRRLLVQGQLLRPRRQALLQAHLHRVACHQGKSKPQQAVRNQQ